MTGILALVAVGTIGPNNAHSSSRSGVATAAATHLKFTVALPSTNIQPNPNFLATCTPSNQSALCLGEEIEAIDNARAHEGLAPVDIRVSTWRHLTAPQQLFAIANLERTSRHLPAIAAMTRQLNGVAAVGASQAVDPSLGGWTLSGGRRAVAWGSNWAGGITDLAANYYWMYDDGTGVNVDCTPSNSAGCWGHRKNILATSTSSCPQGGTPRFFMGAAVTTAGRYQPSDAEIMVQACGAAPSDVVFTWAQAQRILKIRPLSTATTAPILGA
ncbi:MAG TPA: hypothetical protein VG368_02895 [Acidimicrobiales bacterium]|nr:hypothetical protein [Acidimicrobiales bacterium]